MSTRFELVPFHDNEILTVDRDGEIHVVLRPVIEAMGLDWSATLKRIKRHPVLSKSLSIEISPVGITPTPRGHNGHGDRHSAIISLEHFHGVLMTISPERIKDENARNIVIRYQEEAFRAVFEHFHGPLRVVETKRASVADLLRVGNALKRERNRQIRALLWQEMNRICDSWNVDRIPHEGIGLTEPDHSELLTIFWNGVRAIEDAGHIVNHSRRNHLVALNLPELRHHFHEIGVPVEIDTSMTQALRLSRNPAYLADKTYNCRDDKRRHCWLFSHAPLLEAMEDA